MDAALTGALVVDKPEGWTSHDVVSRVRRLANTKRVGHLGTLDPLATGVLPLLLGRATRLAQFYTGAAKGYDATLRFGFSTSTYDRDGEATSPASSSIPSRCEIDSALQEFRGEISMVPPAVSAKKVGGKPAYRLAREGKPVELKPIAVTISELTLLDADGDRAQLRVLCSAGTYVRTLVHDLGQRLGCGAHLHALRRTRSGDFTLPQSHRLDELQTLAEQDRFAEALLPAGELLPAFPAHTVDSTTEGFIRQGRDFRVSPFRVTDAQRYVRALSASGDLVAIGEAVLPLVYHPVCVL